MSRFFCILPLVGLTLGACVWNDDAPLPPPPPKPMVTIMHHGAVVTHSAPEMERKTMVACGNGRELKVSVFAIDGNFPASFSVKIDEAMTPDAVRILAFGGSFTRTDGNTVVKPGFFSGQSAEVATRMFSEMADEKPIVHFSVMPTDGTHQTGFDTVRIEAAAIDRNGREERTRSIVLGTAETLCTAH